MSSSREPYEREFRESALGEKSILDVQYLKNACGGDARTLEDCGFVKCIDLFTYWFYERDNLKALLEKPIIPWRVCDLNEGFEGRIQRSNGSEARNHLLHVLQSGEAAENSEGLKSIEISETILKELNRLGLKTTLNSYVYWCYEPENFEKLMRDNAISPSSRAEILESFENVETGKNDLAWRTLDGLLRKRTAFISHLLLD